MKQALIPELSVASKQSGNKALLADESSLPKIPLHVINRLLVPLHIAKNLFSNVRTWSDTCGSGFLQIVLLINKACHEAKRRGKKLSLKRKSTYRTDHDSAQQAEHVEETSNFSELLQQAVSLSPDHFLIHRYC